MSVAGTLACFTLLPKASSPSSFVPFVSSTLGSPLTPSTSLSSLRSTSRMSAKKFVYGSDDALFGYIEKKQHDRPFGDVLDAGTGLHSLRWLATLPERGLTSLTAITADETMRVKCQREVDHLGCDANILIGNWFGDKPLQLDQRFDLILADYLIGALDGFSPYKQDEMVPKLAHLLKPGGRLYIVGLEPIPDVSDSIEENANVICRVRQVRDACILLAGHRCYREYPKTWVESHLGPDLALLESKEFPILYRHETILKQINVGRSKLRLLDPLLANAMRQTLEALEMESLAATSRSPTGRIQLGFDYVIVAEKQGTQEKEEQL